MLVQCEHWWTDSLRTKEFTPEEFLTSEYAIIKISRRVSRNAQTIFDLKAK